MSRFPLSKLPPEQFPETLYGLGSPDEATEFAPFFGGGGSVAFWTQGDAEADIAQALNDARQRTVRGGQWNATQVKRALDRATGSA